jgi:hypothetical protein
MGLDKKETEIKDAWNRTLVLYLCIRTMHLIYP